MASEEKIPFNEEECCGDTGYMERLCSAQEISGKVISSSMGLRMSMVCITVFVISLWYLCSISFRSMVSCVALVISLSCLIKY